MQILNDLDTDLEFCKRKTFDQSKNPSYAYDYLPEGIGQAAYAYTNFAKILI
ncbi:MAG TPA: hypothetical protein VFC65_18890 [Prolixibacteraceae bacterium]|nr:hypothetical protein [Prolixibacteraceae bacterium]